jgi:microcystin-dependent protein
MAATYGTPTTNYALPKIDGSSDVSDVDQGIGDLADAVDANMAGRSAGTLAARAGVTPTDGKFYRATDTGQVFMGTGSTWIEIGVSPWEPGDLKSTWLTVAPTGWLLCDGAAVSRATYAALFAAIGTSAGAGNGSTTFNVPDYRGCLFVMPDGSAGRMANYDSRGLRGGVDEITLTYQNMPAQVPVITGGDTISTTAGGAGAGKVPSISSISADNWGNGGGVNVEAWPPYLVGGAVLIKT